MGVIFVSLTEGLSALRRPLDMRGSPPNLEPIKRAGFHVFYIVGAVALFVAAIGTAVAWI